MSSKYFTMPSFARAKQDKEEPAQTTPQEPLLKDKDEKFLEQHMANDAPPADLQDVAATKISDDGEEKEASMQEQVQADHPTDQAVIPETQPEADDPSKDAKELSYDDLMREKAAERVKARKEKKRRTMDLPSQEEAEAATKGFQSQIDQNADNAAQNEKRTWISYLSSLSSLPSLRPSSRQSNNQPEQQSEQQQSPSDEASQQQTWKAYAASYVPNALKPSNKAQASRPASPVYNEDGSIDEAATRDKQEREVSALLDNLSLSQMNNRVFSFSADTQKIYERFAQVLKDTINGGPTAYEDMEKLMREAGPKLEQQFKALPPFVQTLVKSLPAKIGGTLGPEFLAIAGEKPGADMRTKMEKEAAEGAGGKDGEGKKQKKKTKRRIPGLKTLLSKEGAVASMLRNVVTFLQTRFPFLASTTSVAMSLAVFILMFVFWYCHKRGKEVRLAKEAEGAGSGEVLGEVADDEEEDDDEDGDGDDAGEEDDDEPVAEDDEKYQALLKDVEAKANTLGQPRPDDDAVEEDDKKAKI